jgi:hypothetical protein
VDERAQAKTGLLGDTPQRDYAEKLRLFYTFARPELCEAIDKVEDPRSHVASGARKGTGPSVP